ncbi:hypothetical protein AB0F03_36565 [Streptomyces sp. NPDC028722]
MPPEQDRPHWQSGDVPMWHSRTAQAVYLAVLVTVMAAVALQVALG